MKNQVTRRMAGIFFLAAFFLLSSSCENNHSTTVVGPYPDSYSLHRCLLYWTASYSDHSVNHYYVGKTDSVDSPIQAFVYWKEERTLIEFLGIKVEPENPIAESLAFHHALKLDRDTVDSMDDISGSTYLVTHKHWVELMEKCIALGSQYTIQLDDAKKEFSKDH